MTTIAPNLALIQAFIVLWFACLFAFVFRRPRRYGWRCRGYVFPRRRYRFRFFRNRALRRRQAMFRSTLGREPQYQPTTDGHDDD